ncbi:MAG TPA: glucose-1-phosphate cytidylyltransferase [Thermoanaerobaculia bacterium]|jgi:glucose-1-phosphate cytidylyltransferase|nr:glucose-1-phosphate cytidylyltransferase [Thermoanaerobaculia bacterium]
MKTIILAGGAGTRLSEETGLRPKPMLEIGEHPILWHIMQIYGSQGFGEFLVALGYKGEVIKDYFLNFYARNADLTVRLGHGENKIHSASPPDWIVHLVDTGLATQTGGRMRRLSSWLGGETFMMTYGDGVADVDLKALVAFHRSHGKLATITAVRPPARFGALLLDNDRVAAFAEKPQVGEGWINGGFFVLEPAVLDLIGGDDTLWELDPLNTLAARGELMAYRHAGFWQPMDTLREKRLLEEMWQSGKAPWKRWA